MLRASKQLSPWKLLLNPQTSSRYTHYSLHWKRKENVRTNHLSVTGPPKPSGPWFDGVEGFNYAWTSDKYLVKRPTLVNDSSIWLYRPVAPNRANTLQVRALSNFTCLSGLATCRDSNQRPSISGTSLTTTVLSRVWFGFISTKIDLEHTNLHCNSHRHRKNEGERGIKPSVCSNIRGLRTVYPWGPG